MSPNSPGTVGPLQSSRFHNLLVLDSFFKIGTATKETRGFDHEYTEYVCVYLQQAVSLVGALDTKTKKGLVHSGSRRASLPCMYIVSTKRRL